MSSTVSVARGMTPADSAQPHCARPRRIVLVSGSIGAGHHAAARAVEERARAVWPGIEVRQVETLAGMGRGTGPVFRAIYAGCVRYLPWLYELYFWLLWHVLPFRAGTRAVIGAWSARGLAPALAPMLDSADLVVATFPEGITGLAWLRRRGRLPATTVALVADPAPHPLWADPALDMHLVSTPEGARLLAKAAPGAAVRVAALPVVEAFRPPGRTAARGELLVYVSCGSLAFGDVAAVCAAVLDAGATVLVSCGRVPALLRRLERLAATHPRGTALDVRDWVADPAVVTRECDVVVTNAGGATALEALACARPLLLVAPIPGHGRANAEVLAAAGLARICPRPADLTGAVGALHDPAERERVTRELTARLEAGDLASDVRELAALPRRAATERVRAQDALFLHAETPQVPQQVGARIVIDDPDGRDDWPAHLAALVRERGPGIPLLRRRLAPARFGRPLRWVEADPEPARHVRPDVVAIGPSLSWDEAVTQFFSRQADPARTGWELQVAQDRAAGRVAVLAKVHHTLGDGLAVTDALIRLLTDGSPQPASSSPVTTVGRRWWPVVRGITSLALAGPAGRSPLTGAGSGPHEHISVALDGAAVRAAARAHGVGTTVLLLAVVADTLHGLLAERGTARVRAMVPMTTRTRAGVGSRANGNRTAAISIDLPTGPMPAAERVAHVAAALDAGAAGGQPEGAAAVLSVLGTLPGPVQRVLVRRIYGRRFFHMIASVMPGSRRALHVRGGLIREAYPVLPLADGVGLAVGALQWGTTIGIGVTVDPALVPERAGIVDRLGASLNCMHTVKPEQSG
ncbi:wax ester/triacylglycerol synthase domain-containing protein [Pseudonocardia sp. TRM90224]|uniref:wax ester/triacylglycerol synthase domain-containing protein n=1 Tax=Pseudonocardia sp. TRM90224 TaxID=2812678 RepID=UPI001E46DF4E|nr:wax ester/triacylglycerol synthase domain-containing protein [Pseudonocardia sp. TRM90224]